jgi:hypothetical protein
MFRAPEDDGRMVALPSRELAVPARSSLPVWMPIVLAGAIAIGVGVVHGLRGAALPLVVVGVLGLLLAAVALLRPPTLVVDAEGIALRTPLGERWRRPWSECDEFRTWRTFVVWNSAEEAARYPRRAAAWRKRADADAGVVAQFGGLSSTDLAALLNRYRSATTPS